MTENRENSGEVCGVVVVDKPKGMTSFDVVARMRRIYSTRRVGHTGTLDPDATGVLVVLVGRAAKAAEYISAGRKVYEAVLRLGVVTDTEDMTGTVMETCDEIPPRDSVFDAAKSFVGEYRQTPPMWSAKKRDGQKLVDIARRGGVVDREPVTVTVYGIEIEATENPDEYRLGVVCSGGTYIRTLCADIGARLHCGGCMADLRRIETGGFTLRDAHTIEEIASDPEGVLMPADTLFPGTQASILDFRNAGRIRNGQSIQIGTAIPDGMVRIYDGDGFFALGEVKGGMLKALKLFVL